MTTDWRTGAILYQIYPRSFLDTTGNGIGDLDGICRKLDYLADLGVDGIWISPIFRSPMFDAGYDVSDYKDIDALFGDLNAFDTLLAAAQARGLKVLIDQVYSHTSDQHPWFQDSRKSRETEHADWYVWEDPRPDGSPPNNWQAWFATSAWTWDPKRRQYYMSNFHSRMPDLNYHNPRVQDAILDVAKFWLDRGVDGFRLDTCNFYAHDTALKPNPAKENPNAASPAEMQKHIHNICQPETLLFLERLRRLSDTYEARLLMGEISTEGQDVLRTAEYTQPGRLHTAYSFQFLRDAFSPHHFSSTFSAIATADGDALPTLAFSNHDIPRVATRWADGTPTPALTRMINTLLLFLRGNACLYQGQELGLLQADVPFEALQDPAALTGWPQYKGRDGCRTPMPWDNNAPSLGFSTGTPWLPVSGFHCDFTVNQQIVKPDSALNHMKSALEFRKRYDALISGSMEIIEASKDRLVFTREAKGDRWICMFNFSDQPVSITDLKRVDTDEPSFRSANDMAGRLAPYGYLIARASPP